MSAVLPQPARGLLQRKLRRLSRRARLLWERREAERRRRRRKEQRRRVRSRAAECERLSKVAKPMPKTVARMRRLGMRVPS